MRYCKKTTIPESAVNVSFDNHGISSVYNSGINFTQLTKKDWKLREKKFEKIIKNNKSKNYYDCIIGVSGGKDSYFQAHIIVKKYGLKPLLVTYHGNNYLPEGNYNRDRMRLVFDADHIVFGPSIEVIKKLNRICFKKLGDMNWQAHCGIFTYPIQVAVKYKIPIIIWGEIVWDIAGMHTLLDYPEFSARIREEHSLRGYAWHDLIKNNDERDHLDEKDMLWAKYPDDESIAKLGVRGLYIGNYFKWDANQHVKLMKKKYGWLARKKPFERTYRNFSNLDDMYENGVHDYMKFIKFGYGRATDHTTKDILGGYMSRKEGIALVRKHDHVIPSDLYHWLKYVDMSESEFFTIADTFRDPRVWWIENNQWHKCNIWGKSSSYGKVYLKNSQKKKYLIKQKKFQPWKE